MIFNRSTQTGLDGSIAHHLEDMSSQQMLQESPLSPKASLHVHLNIICENLSNLVLSAVNIVIVIVFVILSHTDPTEATDFH